MTKGWTGESERHRLASYGIKTGTKDYSSKKKYKYNENTFKPRVISTGKILQKNPRSDRFPKCNYVTKNLIEKMNQIEMARNMKRVFPYAPRELWGNLMLYGNELQKEHPKAKILKVPTTDEGVDIWFVKNENGGYTAMLPSDW